MIAIPGSDCSTLMFEAVLVSCGGDMTNLFETLKAKISNVAKAFKSTINYVSVIGDKTSRKNFAYVVLVNQSDV